MDRQRSTRAALLAALAVAIPVAAWSQSGENLASPEQKAQQEKAQHTTPGRIGTTEPSSLSPTTKPNDTEVFVDGRLVVPGAPADSQTVPSIISERNAALDALPTMAYPLPLDDAQRQRIRAAASDAPVVQTNVHPADEMPSAIEVRLLPDQLTAEIPAVRNLGFVRASDRLLLVLPASRVVVAEFPSVAVAR
jgi:hypothetical protein